MNIRNTDKEYFLIVNSKELYDAAADRGYDSIVVFEGNMFSQDEINDIKATGKAVSIVFFYIGEGLVSRLKDQLKSEGVPCWACNMADEYNKANEEISSVKEAAEYFFEVDMMESFLKQFKVIHETDYTDRCGNCHMHIGPHEKYCKYCGTEKGKGKFLPFFNTINCVYGPQVKKKYKCSECGHIWITTVMGGDNSKYCPECGKKAVNLLERKAANGFFFD